MQGLADAVTTILTVAGEVFGDRFGESQKRLKNDPAFHGLYISVGDWAGTGNLLSPEPCTTAGPRSHFLLFQPLLEPKTQSKDLSRLQVRYAEG